MQYAKQRVIHIHIHCTYKFEKDIGIFIHTLFFYKNGITFF